MAGMQEELDRRLNRPQPRAWRTDHTTPGFEVPEAAEDEAAGPEGAEHG